MSTPLVDSVWGGEVTIGPQIKYAGALESSMYIRVLVPLDRVKEFDAVVADAYQRKSSIPFGCHIVVFEDWSIHAINSSNYGTLCELTANQGAACVRCGYALQKLDDEQRAAVGEDAVSATGTSRGAASGTTDGAGATGTTGSTTGENTDGATA
jgi:hypothetical protein